MAEKKQQFWSNLDPSNKFSTFKEADEHDRRLQQSRGAKEAINKFNRVAPTMDAARVGGSDYVDRKSYMDVPKSAVSDADLQANVEKDVVKEMYGNNRMALARGYGLGTNESPEAKGFMDGEKAIAEQQGGDVEGQEIERALDVIKNDPNLGEGSAAYKMLVAVKTDPDLSKAILKSYSLVGRDVAREQAMRPEKALTSAATTAASTGTRIKTEAGLSGLSAATDAESAAAKTVATSRAEIDTEFAQLPESIRPTRKVTPEAADKLALKAQGLNGAFQLKGLLESGEVGYWDLGNAGDFTNPKARQAYQDMLEGLARMNTGAAFTDSEDKRFMIQLGNKNFLTTEKGRIAMAQGINNFIERQKGSGRVMWGNDGWIKNYGVKEPSVDEEIDPDLDAMFPRK